MFRIFPLLLLPVIFYNLIALGGGAILHNDVQDMLSYNHALSITMFSGDQWKFSFGDFLVLLTLALLFVEVVKATRTTKHEIINHGLSLLTFVVALVEFIVLKGFATTPFFFIMTMTLFDVVAGYTISIIAAEHDEVIPRASTDALLKSFRAGVAWFKVLARTGHNTISDSPEYLPLLTGA